eukprot:Gb_03268 [translate_table: standard]
MAIWDVPFIVIDLFVIWLNAFPPIFTLSSSSFQGISFTIDGYILPFLTR